MMINLTTALFHLWRDEQAKCAMTGDHRSPEVLLNATLGLPGEVGEILDVIKKHKTFGKHLDREHLTEELGDALYYLFRVAAIFHISVEDVLLQALVKLRGRFPQGFSSEAALARADKHMSATEKRALVASFVREAYTLIPKVLPGIQVVDEGPGSRDGG